jgi:hypothetical protein
VTSQSPGHEPQGANAFSSKPSSTSSSPPVENSSDAA